MRTILSSRRDQYLVRVSIFLIIVVLIAGMVGCGGTSSASVPIWDWYDLRATRDNLGGNYFLMRNLDSTTAGYKELASETANQGKGWQPIGTPDKPFTGTFDGQGYEIRGLFIDRPSESYVGLFGFVDGKGTINNVGVVNASVTGDLYIGGLVGVNWGTVSNSYFTGNVSGNDDVGCLVGGNGGDVSNSYSTGSVSGNYLVGGLMGGGTGSVDNSYFTGSVSGQSRVGGLVGGMSGTTVSNSYSTASVNGTDQVGGLVGYNYGTVSKSHSSGSVTGDSYVGGLVGWNRDTVSNSYSTSSVTGEWLVGGLVGHNRGTVSKSYSIGSVTGSEDVGGLVGRNFEGTVSNSFWDTETSGQAISDGGTGRNTTEMQNVATFSGAGWNIIAVGDLDERNPAYICNIVNGVTYPFLSWEL
jgi:hypothetical protein